MREWNAGAYHQISNPQFAMAMPVLARLPLAGDEMVLDIGCGTGRVTEHLLERVPRGRVLAIDLSINMLTAAREHLASRFDHRIGFLLADAASLPVAGVADAIFSTATFHWVLDHDALFRSLWQALTPGGRLVVQCGGAGNLDRIHHRATELMASREWAGYFTRWREPWEFADTDTTSRRLDAAGFVDIHAWLEPAPIVQPDAATFGTFVTNVILRHHLAYLPTAALRESFVAQITDRAAQDSPAFELDYQRLNIDARKPGEAPA